MRLPTSHAASMRLQRIQLGRLPAGIFFPTGHARVTKFWNASCGSAITLAAQQAYSTLGTLLRRTPLQHIQLGRLPAGILSLPATRERRDFMQKVSLCVYPPAMLLRCNSNAYNWAGCLRGSFSPPATPGSPSFGTPAAEVQSHWPRSKPTVR